MRLIIGDIARNVTRNEELDFFVIHYTWPEIEEEEIGIEGVLIALIADVSAVLPGSLDDGRQEFPERFGVAFFQ